MEVTIKPDNKKLSIGAVKDVKELIKQIGYGEEEVLIIDPEEWRLLSIDERLRPDQKIEIRKVISGG
ncbi:MAG TPA: hypothetical protein EYP58_01080 [bacterium (Candidatus Stahlbacteria)]|nr:hypothetical protein [Candidatus Stahlbacteria bacterium]